MIADELKKWGIFLSPNTVYSYMKSLGLKSITRRKYVYNKGDAHEVFEDLLNRNFTANKPNEKWCTDFTYLHLSTGENGIIALFWIFMIGVLLHQLPQIRLILNSQLIL